MKRFSLPRPFLLASLLLTLSPLPELRAGAPDKKPPPLQVQRNGGAAQMETVVLNGKKASATRILAKLRTPAANPGVLSAGVTRTLERHQARVMKTFEHLPELVVLEVQAPDVQTMTSSQKQGHLETTLKSLQATGAFEYVEPDWMVTLQQAPTDSSFINGELWGLRNTGQNGGVSGVDVNAVNAWTQTTGSPNVIIGVIDTGVRYTHQDLQGNMWTNPGEIPGNGLDDDNNGYVDDVFGINAINGSGDPMDDNGHGSHCAGTIAATGNDAGRHVGVAYTSRIMALKFLAADGSGSTSDAIECINYALSKNVTLLSNSWGGGGFSFSLRDAISAANDQGVLFVCAAGNEAADNDRVASYPANYTEPNVLSVAAIDRQGNLASFSNFGRTSVDLGAPGVSILSSTSSSNTSYSTYSGTSMACPHVAGVAALLKSQQPSLTPSQLIDRILSTTTPLASLNNRTASGGMVNAGAALNASPDGQLEANITADLPLNSGEGNAIRVVVTDLSPVTGASVSGGLSGGTVQPFFDNGISPDSTADDGIYTALVQIPATGSSVDITVNATKTGFSGVQQTTTLPVASPPSNDDFANRISLLPGTTSTTGSNEDASRESGEPRRPSASGDSTVWWSWTSGTTGTVVISTSGSNFDTTLAVYQGTTLGSLQERGSNDDADGLQSQVSFQAVSGQTYQIQVSGYSNNTGDIVLSYPSPNQLSDAPIITSQPNGTSSLEGQPFQLNVTATGATPLSYQWFQDQAAIPGATQSIYSVAASEEADEGLYFVRVSNSAGTIDSREVFIGVNPVGLTPDNNDFANASPLSGASGRISGTTLLATGEPGEPNHAGQSTPLTSVWYRWVAPADGTLAINTFGSDFDTTLAVYTGTQVSALSEVTSNNDAQGVQSAVSLAVTEGQDLRIAVDGQGSNQGLVVLDYAFTPSTAPTGNDSFAQRTPLPARGGTVQTSNIGATGEPNEPNHADGASTPLSSLWWSFTPTVDTPVVLSTQGSDFDTTLAVYTGSTLATLTEVASNDDAGGQRTSQLTFNARAFQSYAIVVDGFSSAEGNIQLTVTPNIQRPTKGDFDGDGISDLALHDPTASLVYLFQSTNGFKQIKFGRINAKMLGGDFDGDGQLDLAAYRSGFWQFLMTSAGQAEFLSSNPSAIPVVGYFDNDSIQDFGTYFPLTGFWEIQGSLGKQSVVFGFAGTVPVVKDWDGDGIDDFGVYHPPTGAWYIFRSSLGFYTTNFGFDGTVPVTRDFDGDGLDDIGCFHPPTGQWYFFQSQNGFTSFVFGFQGTIPLDGDFDGDGIDDAGVYYPATGTWYIFRSRLGFKQEQFGYGGTVPVQ